MKKIIFSLIISTCLLSYNNTQEFKPIVSIITSVFNGDEFISGFLSDITRQNMFDQCELILINANSPGQEEPIIKEYMKKFSNIIYKKLDNDPGLYAVWNIAIKMARGKYITNANLDDRRNPESIELHVKALDSNLDIDLVYSDFYITCTPNETYEFNTKQSTISHPDFSPEIMHMCITGPQPMWRKSIHEKCGYFDESFVIAGDFEMWNRAVSKGAKLKKVPGVSGLFYLNPKGLSTDKSKKEIHEKELHIVNEKYSLKWTASLQYFCTACDSKYFAHLLNLIGSIQALDFNTLGEIAVFDLGLTKDQVKKLNMIEKVSIKKIELTHPDILQPFKTSKKGKTVPGFYAWKFVILKQALELYPYFLYVDSGTTILRSLNNLFKYIQEAGYFFCTMGDESTGNQIYHPIRWGTTDYVKNYFNLNLSENIWILEQEPLLSGTIGISRKALDYLIKPLYTLSKNLKLFEDDGSTPNGFGTGRHDQSILSIFAYLNGLTIHHQDYTDQVPIYLNTRLKNEEFYITWNKDFVNSKTHIYNSRSDLSNYENYIKAIRCKF